jgi:hypothetical protein
MRTTQTIQQRKDFINENWRLETLNFRWSRSGVCRIYDKRSEPTKFEAGGHGYDKKGKALGHLINEHFCQELKRLSASEFYGLSHYNPNGRKGKKFIKRATNKTRSYVDGACGFDCMRRILEKIGYKMHFVQEGKDAITYILKAS